MYLWNHTHCNDDITQIVFMTLIFMEVYELYMTYHPRFLTSQHSIQFISLLYLISNWIYLTTHTLHLLIHTQIIDHITPIVFMITQAQYAWHHVNTYEITSTLYDITPRYDIHIQFSCHHTQNTCRRIHGSWAFT